VRALGIFGGEWGNSWGLQGPGLRMILGFIIIMVWSRGFTVKLAVFGSWNHAIEGSEGRFAPLALGDTVDTRELEAHVPRS
jgi:hypothetical protein